jgi:hypothetical protein
MHARHGIVTAPLALVTAVLVASCVGRVDSTTPDDGAGGANMTPASEPVGEVAEGLGFCGCATASDYCWLTVGGTCIANFNNCTKTPVRGCGLGLLSPCNGECVRR